MIECLRRTALSVSGADNASGAVDDGVDAGVRAPRRMSGPIPGLLLALAASALTACGGGGGAVPDDADIGPAVTYLCRDQSMVVVSYGRDGIPPSGIQVDLDGKKTWLRRVTSSIEPRYSHGQLIWWEKENRGFLEHYGRVIKRQCKPT